jgi:hypothetical protein
VFCELYRKLFETAAPHDLFDKVENHVADQGQASGGRMEPNTRITPVDYTDQSGLLMQGPTFGAEYAG